ncbi:MAG: hypothetical protein ACREM3_01775 [Candidatus Rokuibacteriota bacterium]
MVLAAGARAWGQPLTGPIELSLPSLSWAVTVPATGFVVESDQTARDGTTRRFLAKQPETGVIVSGLVELARPGVTSSSCREFYWTGLSRRLDGARVVPRR